MRTGLPKPHAAVTCWTQVSPCGARVLNRGKRRSWATVREEGDNDGRQQDKKHDDPGYGAREIHRVSDAKALLDQYGQVVAVAVDDAQLPESVLCTISHGLGRSGPGPLRHRNPVAALAEPHQGRGAHNCDQEG